MKRVVLILVIAAISCQISSAQSLKEYFNSSRTQGSMSSGQNNAVNFDISGEWIYSGVAVSSSSVKKQIDDLLAKAGISAACMSFKFNQDDTFTGKIKDTEISGTWSIVNNSSILLSFGKTMKYLNMTCELKSSNEGFDIILTDKKFSEFLSNVMEVANEKTDDATINAVTSLFEDNKISPGISFKRK